MSFQFHESPNTACFVCDHVMNRQRPILWVCHDQEDGAWQFLCGDAVHTDENIRLISLQEATEIDPSINDLSELPPGVGAERNSAKDAWEPFRLE